MIRAVIGKAQAQRFVMGETVYLDLHTFAIIHKPMRRKGGTRLRLAVTAINRKTGTVTIDRVKRKKSTKGRA